MLPGYSDCARRGAARQFRKQINDAGFELRDTRPSAGALLGDANHLSAAELLRGRAHENIISIARINDAIEMGWELFKEKMRDGVEWDDTTKNSFDAGKQLEKMVHSVVGVCQTMRPAQIEYKLEALLANGALLTGHLDVREEFGTIWDFKTGKRKPTPWAQLGGYAYSAIKNNLPASQVGMIYIPRVPASKDQPAVIIEKIEVTEAISSARSALHYLFEHLQKFTATGNPWAFPANPMSLMCSATYCPAHGTPFCKVGKPGGN